AGEVLINSIDNDGMMKGYDLEALEAVVDSVDIPIVVAGGCGSKKHCVDAVKAGASAVAGGSVFFWIGESIRTIKALEVRLM
ncbi:MAG: HisA/HisF-related TIM barrel protein, partial [Gammaproteobacteria bacterium]